MQSRSHAVMQSYLEVRMEIIHGGFHIASDESTPNTERREEDDM